jgi:rhamnulokinase
MANFTNETGVGGTSRFLKNASGLWLIQECRRVWAAAGLEYSYAELAAMAEGAEPFRSLVNPDDAVFLRPADMTAAIAEFCRRTSQPVPETPGDFVRCIVESLALLYASVLDRLAAVTGRSLSTLHVVGGGSQNAGLNQATADATGLTVLAGPVEATAIGNVLLQALTLGLLPSLEAAREVVRDSFPQARFAPNPDARWKAARARFDAITRDVGAS